MFNRGGLTLTACTVSGNTASLSGLGGGGGGVFNRGTLTQVHSTVTGNTADEGGGVFNRGVLTLANSTLSGNTASYSGGGVYNEGTLMIRTTWRNDWTYLCNLQTPWKGVSTEACFSWFGLLTAARTHSKPIGIYYVGDTPCSALAVYGGAPAPVYLRMAE